ncbi:MAG: class I SAM-dependent methyltransferase [Bacteroidia bacterium]
MSEFENTNCLVCLSNDYLPYSSKGQFGIETNVVICKNCGFSYLNPRWNKQRYNYFYTKEYDTYYRPEVIKSNYKYDSASGIKTIVSRSAGIINFKKDNLSILDIGAGMGDSLIYLKSSEGKNSDYYAIESSEHCVKHLTENGIKVISTDVDSNWHEASTEKFDVIIMRHVLEHFLDPGDILKKVHSVLKPNGVLYVAVPNAKKPTKPLQAHFFRVVHVSYFSELSLTNIFNKNGLGVIKMVDGDAADQHEIFSFIKKDVIKPAKVDATEWKLQKHIYDSLLKKEVYYRFRDFVAKNIIARFK